MKGNANSLHEGEKTAFQCSLQTLMYALFAVTTAAQLSNSWTFCVTDSAYVNMHLLLALRARYHLARRCYTVQLQEAFSYTNFLQQMDNKATVACSFFIMK